MDNKLTKKRLSDFLAYEWILTIIAVVAAIVVLELVYTVSATRLSVGQQFKYYLDENFYTYDNYSLYDLLEVRTGENGKTFSYDVLSVETENLSSSYNVLSVRLSVQEGDAIFTSSEVKEEDGKIADVRAKSIIDEYAVYDMRSLLDKSKEYLNKFVAGGGDVYNEEDYDEDAIRAYFDTRMKGDKRFKTAEEKEKGRADEVARIKKLAADTEDFETLLTFGEEKGLLYKYTKYEQVSSANPDNENYKKAYEAQKTDGKENLVYGFNMAAFTGGTKNVSDYLKLSGNTDAKDVVLILFDFSADQYDLQFESISFTVTLAKEFSNILG